MTIDGTAGVTFNDGSVQGKAVPAAPQSMVRLTNNNGVGSTNTAIRRFLNVVTNQGTGTSYVDSATLGATFTINTNGVYALSYSEGFSAAANFGLSLNSTQLTTSIDGITAADVLAISTTSAAGFQLCVGGSFYLPAGSVVRAHGNATAAGAAAQFTITRVA